MAANEHDAKLTRRQLLGAAALLAAGPPAALAEDSIGSVADIKGAATAMRASKSRDLGMQSAVFTGDAVTTAPNGRLSLALAGKTRLRLGGGTRVVLDKYVANSGGTLELGSGALKVDAKPGAFPKGLKVESPYAIIAVRGTVFYAGLLDKVYSVFVESGEVRVSAAGKAVNLGPGEGTGIRERGAKPGAVKKWKPPKIAKIKSLVA